MNLGFGIATEDDAPTIASLRARVAEVLTRQYGRGHWSSCVTEKGVLRGIKTSRVVIARLDTQIVGTLRLATKKPWAIDPAYFTSVKRPLYLLDMAVEPALQRQGIGRRLLDHGVSVARAWPSQAIRLDAYDADAGAGGFYARCGFREMGSVVYRGMSLVYFEMLV